MNHHSMSLPRAILSAPTMGRSSFECSDYCSSYGCSSVAKSSGRVALLNHAAATGNLTLKPNARVYHIASDDEGEISAIHYYEA